MWRREFITLLGTGHDAAAQQPERMRRIGVLTSNAENDPEYRASITEFVQALASRGWTEGRNIQIEHRYAAANAERMHAFAKELVSGAPDVLFTSSTPTSVALWQETKSIPIVTMARSGRRTCRQEGLYRAASPRHPRCPGSPRG
jgi:putative ABC transport system substrate-binding protein